MKSISSNRATIRKEARKKKKAEKHLAYTKFNSIKKGNVDDESSKSESVKKINALNKIIKTAKDEMRAKNKKPNDSKASPSKENPSTTNGLTFGNNVDSRMAGLQQYINNVTKESGYNNEAEKSVKKKKNANDAMKKKETKKANTIKNKGRLQELENGIKNDSKEINEIYRQLQFNSKQKKSTTILRNMFGGDIGDIFDVLEQETEAGLFSEENPTTTMIKPERKGKKVKVALPDNTVRINTKQAFFEQDEVPEDGTALEDVSLKNPSKDIAGKSCVKRKNCESIDLSTGNGAKRRKVMDAEAPRKKFVPTVYEFEGLEDENTTLTKKKCRTSHIDIVHDSPPPTHLKSIIQNKKGKLKKKDRLSVSFDLGNNSIRLIPPVQKVSGFKAYEKLSLEEEELHYHQAVLDCIDKEHESSQEEDINKEKENGNDSDEQDSDEENGDENCWESFFGDNVDMEADFSGSDAEEDLNSDHSDIDMEADFSDSDVEGDANSDDSDIHMEAEFSDESDNSNDDDQESPSTADATTKNSKKDSKKESHDSNLTEDIYGRLRDSEGNIVANGSIGATAVEDESAVGYSSPAVRRQDPQLQEQLRSDALKSVRTQLRGRLNRLAEINLAGTVSMVTGLYSNHPRQLLNVVLSELLLAELAGDGTTLDRHCQECAVLLAATAANVAEEIGAHIMTDFVVSWHAELQAAKGGAGGGGVRLRNYVLFVTHLYSFGLVHAVLLYDMLMLLVSDITPDNVEQMIVMVGGAGFLLRKDDPQALLQFILRLQEGTAKLPPNSLPQLQVLNAMLKAVKTNNESKMPNYDPTYTEHLRKLLRAFVGGDGKLTPVRVTLEDLLLSETRGRWWVVGSAWTGASMLQDRRPAAAGSRAAAPTSKALDTSSFSSEFMKLAENMRITRPPKINILFALTVGSENNHEAFSKLLALSLPPAQEKFIFDVMLFCIQKMKVYKPFYHLLAIDMCTHDHKYKRLLQHALWDKFSDFDALKMRELKHLAKFVFWIVKVDALNLSVLKTLPFAETDPKVVAFLRDVFCQLFEDESGCHVSKDAFEKLFKSAKLQQVRMQFKMFLEIFIVAKVETGELKPKNSLFSRRVRDVLDRLATDQGILL